MNQLTIVLISAAIIGLTFTSVAAQTTAEEKPIKTKFAIGLNFNPEGRFGGGNRATFHPSFGLTFEARFSEHSGLELGVFDRITTGEY